jgi:formyltetrahydrofolate synthetase
MGTLAIAACHRRDDSATGISVQEQIMPQPPRVGPATVVVQLADASQKPVAHATIMVEADMSHPGMGPVFGVASETDPGNYKTKIDFNMGGDWIVLLHIKLADGRKIERQMDVRGVRSN